MNYDAGGNLTNDTYMGQGARTYDAENHMKQAWGNNQWQTYVYDGDAGCGIKRIVNGAKRRGKFTDSAVSSSRSTRRSLHLHRRKKSTAIAMVNC